MTDEQTEAYVKALLEERKGYETHGKTDRVEAVDAELKRLGARAKSPRQRAESRGQADDRVDSKVESLSVQVVNPRKPKERSKPKAEGEASAKPSAD